MLTALLCILRGSMEACSAESCCAIELQPVRVQTVCRLNAMLHAWSSNHGAAAGMARTT